jgi:hypothetical protein
MANDYSTDFTRQASVENIGDCPPLLGLSAQNESDRSLPKRPLSY